MKKFFNAIIILFSLYTIFMIIRGEQSLFFYMTLFLVQWLAIMIFNPMLRKVTFNKLYRSSKIGDENSLYGNLNYNNVEEVITGLSQEAFKELVKDVLQMKGYDIKEESESEETIIASLDDKEFAVKIKARSEEVWEVQPDFIEEAISNSKVGNIIIITNGRFNKASIKIAKSNKVMLINEARFITWIRGILYERDEEARNKNKKRSRPQSS